MKQKPYILCVYTVAQTLLEDLKRQTIKMTYCTITPTRPGERKPLFEFCMKQLKELTGGTRNFVMNDPPKNGEADLIPRIRKGIELANEFDYAYIVEDDDFYTAEHFNQNLDFDFFGYEATTYYNLRNRTYETFKHPGRSSLFTTAFKISALEGFTWPADNVVFLDIALWDYAKKTKKKINLLKYNPCLGIKHGLGKVGGKGHRMTMKNKDPDLKFLRSRVNEDAFNFYEQLIKTL